MCDLEFRRVLFRSKVKEESEKVGLKLNIQKTKIMAFGPITSWEMDGETVEKVSAEAPQQTPSGARGWLQSPGSSGRW